MACVDGTTYETTACAAGVDRVCAGKLADLVGGWGEIGCVACKFICFVCACIDLHSPSPMQGAHQPALMAAPMKPLPAQLERTECAQVCWPLFPVVDSLADLGCATCSSPFSALSAWPLILAALLSVLGVHDF